LSNPEAEPTPAELTALEVRSRAAVGAVLVGARGILVRVLSLAGVVALARLLDPQTFGAAAIGLTIVAIAGFASDAGMGAALVRARNAPSREELRSLLGLQLLAGIVLTLLVAPLAIQFGDTGRAAALMMVTVPLAALRTPAIIRLERQLRYGAISSAELLDAIAYYLIAIPLAVLGFGVYSIAYGVMARTVPGTVLLWAVDRESVQRPTLTFRHLRRSLRLGGQIQAIGFVNLIRDQGLSLGLAGIGGTATLGLWTAAYRLLQVPYLLFESLWRVSFPAFSRLTQTHHDVRPDIQRGMRIVEVATGLVLSGMLGGIVALVPTLLGPGWDDVVSVVPPAAAGLLVSGPISVVASGYLFAADDAKVLLRGVVLHTLAWFAVTFPLLNVIGVAAAGWGWLAAALVEATILFVAMKRHVGVWLTKGLVRSVVVTALAAGVGTLVVNVTSRGIVGTVLGTASGLVAYLTLQFGTGNRDVMLLVGALRQLTRAKTAAAD
jgi:O-antigen/teichoic acid export membrane protein